MKKINFKNGTLVSKSKVTIDNTIYEVEPEEYEGETPLSAELLNEMQDNIEKAIDEVDTGLNNKINGTVLYEDATGTNGAVTFNEKIQEGDSIEIVYCRRRTDGSSIYKVTGKIPFIEGMETDLDINYFSVPDNQQSISKSITINNDGITVNGENTWGNANGFNNATSTIYIVKVKKYIY